MGDVRQLFRRSSRVAVVDNTDVAIDLSRDAFLQSCWLEFSGTLTIGAVNALGLVADSPESYIRRIRLELDGRTVWETNGPLGRHTAEYLNGVAIQRTAPGFNIGANTFTTFIPLGPYFNQDMSGTDLIVPVTRFNKPRLIVSCGAPATDMVSPDAGTTAALVATVTAHQTLVEWPRGQKEVGLLRRKLMSFTVTGANADQVRPLEETDKGLRVVFIRQLSGAAAISRALVNTVVTNFRADGGGLTLHDWQSTLEMQGTLQRTAQRLAPTAGILVWDPRRDGMNTQCVPFNGVNGRIDLHLTEAIPAAVNNYEIEQWTIDDAAGAAI